MPVAAEVVKGADESAAQATARVASRGVVFIATAKLYFLGVGYAIQFGLAHLLSKELYGAYGTVVSVANVLNMMILQGTLQAVSKLVSESDRTAAAVPRVALRVQLFLAGGLAVAYLLAAPLIADLQNSATHTNVFRLSAGIVFAYGLYAVFVGFLNGRKQFRAQAGLDMTFATLRACGILGFAALGFGVFGAIGGFVGAALLIVAISFRVAARHSLDLFREQSAGKPVACPRERNGEPDGTEGAPHLLPAHANARVDAKKIIRFMLPVMLYTLILYALMNVDLWLLRAFTEGTPEEVDRVAGLYYGAQNLARIPYQAILAVTFVVFPLVSRATFENDTETARGYITITFRYSLIFLAGLVAVVAANASDLLAIPYPAAYREGARALESLAVGMLLFSLFSIACTILIGAGLLRAAVISGAVALAVAVGVSLGLREVSSGFDGRRAAMSVAAGYLAGCFAAGYALFRQFGAPLQWITIARVAIAAGVVAAVSMVRPSGGKIMTLVAASGLVVIYGFVLWATREWAPADSARFRRAFSKRRGGES
ncbi:MAG: oligosaccharide flippase family protein [Deltaproteobacteria bacterium]|nr:oligosaccharide flippase family protein [Deltaproteobacteria bacterium]